MGGGAQRRGPPWLAGIVQDCRGVYYSCDLSARLNERYGDLQHRIQAGAGWRRRQGHAVLRLLTWCAPWPACRQGHAVQGGPSLPGRPPHKGRD